MTKPPPTSQKLGRKFDSLQQEAYLHLWRTYDRLKAIEEELFDRHGLSAQQYNALRLLRAAGPAGLTVQGIGRKLISRAPDMTRMLDRLERRGWIERARRVDNRRVVDVVLTTTGEKLLDQLAEPLHEVHQQQLAHLSQQQLHTLVELLSAARAPHEPAEGPWTQPGAE